MYVGGTRSQLIGVPISQAIHAFHRVSPGLFGASTPEAAVAADVDKSHCLAMAAFPALARI